MLPLNTPQILRSHGLKVVEVPGWQNRIATASSSSFAPVGVLVHHTATGPKTSVAAVLRLLIEGRPDLSGPLCQLGLGRDGTVYIIARGRANHAGEARAAGTVSGGDGNKLYIGIEAFNDGVGEDWSQLMYLAYAKLCAVLCVEITKNSHKTVNGHKETSVTGKIDPTFNMDTFRLKVEDYIKEIKNDDKPVQPPKTKWSRGPKVDAAIYQLEHAKGKGERAKKLQAALANLKLIKPAKVEQKPKAA